MVYYFKSAGLWKNSYEITDSSGQDYGSLTYNIWQSKAAIELGSDTTTIYSEKWYSSNRTIAVNGEEVASVGFKLFKFKPEVHITYKGRLFIMKSIDNWYRKFGLFMENQPDIEIGQVRKKNMWGTGFETEMPDYIDLWFQASLVSLVITFEMLMTPSAMVGR